MSYWGVSYWVVMAATSGQYLWSITDATCVDCGTAYSQTNATFSGVWNIYGDWPLQMRMNVTEADVVPEPAALWLIAPGAFLIFRLRRRT